jgi:hypothetical protein
MDPNTLISTAVISGATVLAKSALDEAGKAAFTALKSLLEQKFSGSKSAQVTLEKAIEKPKIWEAPFKEALAETKADTDEKIIEAARQVIAHIEQHQATHSKYNTQIDGNVQGLVQSDHAEVKMTFDNSSSDK